MPGARLKCFAKAKLDVVWWLGFLGGFRMTFSVVARCARTGQLGVAVSSSSPAVAARCAYAKAGVGAVTTQNITDPRLGPAALALLARGAGAEAALAAVTAGASHLEYRQLTIIDARGGTAVFSGAHTLGVHGQAVGRDVVSAGNLLADQGVPAAVVAAFEASDAGAELGDRILAAMLAGLAAGGEAGPVKSAGMVVVDTQAWPIADLRVDWHDAPLAELTALWALWKPQMRDYVTRALNPSAAPTYGVPGDE
jgi:uncharacterized Ntn-hydrolase superfamily protein